MRYKLSGMIALFLVLGNMAMCSVTRENVRKETVFQAGNKKVYAESTTVDVFQEKGRIKRITLVLSMFRGEVYHLVKAGVIRTVTPDKLIKYKPLKPIIVRFKALPVAVRALNRAWKGKGDINRLFAGPGPWRDLKNYQFILLKQVIERHKIR